CRWPTASTPVASSCRIIRSSAPPTSSASVTWRCRRRRDVSGCDLVVVNPNGRATVYQSLGASLAAVEPPVWAGLLATFVRTRGFSTAIVDAEAEGLDAEVAAERVIA